MRKVFGVALYRKSIWPERTYHFGTENEGLVPHTDLRFG